MVDSRAIWQWLVERLVTDKAAILLIVVNSHGSSPGKAGAKMAWVNEDCWLGTIGGGSVEQALQAQAGLSLQTGNVIPGLYRQVLHESSATGTLCGGEQTVLLYPLHLADLSWIQLLANAEHHRQPVLLTLSTDGAEISSSLSVPPLGFQQHGETWYYQEVIGQARHAYIIGGGHVSLALSQLLNLLAFDVTVIDQREHLATMQNNQYAQEKRIVAYNQIGQAIPSGNSSYVFIMTHSHTTDQQVLAQLLYKPFAYLGLLGSRRKVQQIWQNLSTQFSPVVWQRVHAPMGLPIHSHTPEEIAISIAAEIIQLTSSL